MSTTYRPKTNAEDETAVEELLQRAEKGRTRVSRVLEYVREEGDAGDVRKEDWFAAIEYVAEETGEDLVLYSEDDHPDAPSSATIYAVDDQYGRVIQSGWSECRLPSGTAGYTGAQYVNRNDIEDGFAFDGGRPREVLRLDEAKARLEAFVAAQEGDN